LSHLVQNQISLKETAVSVCSIADGNGREQESDGTAVEECSVEEVTAADARTFRTETFKVGGREGEGWTFWKVRPLPKREKETQKTAGEPETLRHCGTLAV
jgi:hypothetical protein